MNNNIFYLLIISLTGNTASAVPVEYKYPQLFNDTDENVVQMLNVQSEDVSTSETRSDINRYFLFTRRNKYIYQTLVLNDVNSILSSNYNAQRPTIVIAHGFLGNQHMEPNRVIKSAYLDVSDVNIISVDWRRDLGGTPAVGHRLAEFLNFLIDLTRASPNLIHLIGFSLGAHVVGNAGRAMGQRKVARITGLDPAGSTWAISNNRLKPSDALYVEAIHTDGGSGGMGIGMAIADVDFFPNGGESQPGCSSSLCRHYRAGELFAATVTFNHLQGRLCSSMSEVKSDTCRGPSLNMGNDNLNKRGSGMYRVNTGDRYPY